jgi:outer membrane protein assembly factor BamB
VLLYAGPSNLWALDPRTGTVLGHDTSIGYIHWQSPQAAGGRVYIADSNAHLSAFDKPGR